MIILFEFLFNYNYMQPYFPYLTPNLNFQPRKYIMQNDDNSSMAREANHVMTINGTAIKAQTQAGAEYVKKVVHPPTTIPSGYGGVPDCSQPNFVPLEVKCEQNIPTTYTVATDATTTAPVFPAGGRMLLLTPSGGFVSSYAFYWDGQGWISPGNQTALVSPPNSRPAITSNVAATTTSGYNFGNLTNDANVLRTVYKSNTFYLNATEFNNQGTVTCAKFKPTIIHEKLNLLRARMSEKERASFDKAFHIASGKRLPKFETDFEVINDDPKVVDFDYQVQILDTGRGNGTVTVPDALNSNTQKITGSALPNTPADVLTASPKGTTRMAKEGSFVVAQPLEPVQLWTDLVDTTALGGITVPNGLTYSFLRVVNGSSITYMALPNNQYTGNTQYTQDVPWNNLDWSYIMFDGLSQPTFNDAGIPINAPYITDKGYVGIEIGARSSGSLLSFQKLLPLPDPEALQMATGIFHARPDSLPASANDFGTLAKVALQFLPTAVGWLKDVFGKKKQQTQAIRRVTDSAVYRAAVSAKKANPRSRTAPVRNVVAAESRQIAHLTQAVNRMSMQQQPATTQRSFTNSTAFGNIQQLQKRNTQARVRPLNTLKGVPASVRRSAIRTMTFTPTPARRHR